MLANHVAKLRSTYYELLEKRTAEQQQAYYEL